jgi:uncharacterized protein YecT (DUF1311 family)
MTQEYSTCLGKSNGVTIEIINCILAETRRQDARLNENYKRLISKLPTERKNALVEAQRAWNEETLIIGENGYSWEHEYELSCRYSSGKARFDNTIAASTKTVSGWVFHIIAGCKRRQRV